MSAQRALEFIALARRSKDIRAAIAALGEDVSTADLIKIAAAAGFELTATDLQKAHKHDWTMRWARYNRRTPSA